MLRYVLIATCIVVLFGAVAAAVHRAGGPLRMASVQTTGSPSPPRREAPSTFTPGPVTGDAPWALSAVPECFHQESETAGSERFVLARIPHGASLAPPGVTVTSRDCIVWARASDVVLVRGAERLRVPSGRLLLLRDRSRIALLAQDAGRTVLREYRATAPLAVRRVRSGL